MAKAKSKGKGKPPGGPREYRPDDLADPAEVEDRPRVADMVGRVVVGFGGKLGDWQEGEHGDYQPVVLKRLVVFDDQGGIKHDLPDLWITQSLLKQAFLGGKAVVGRITRPANSYRLDAVSDRVKRAVAEALTAAAAAQPSLDETGADDDGGDGAGGDDAF